MSSKKQILHGINQPFNQQNNEKNRKPVKWFVDDAASVYTLSNLTISCSILVLALFIL